jgi:eukaryotic-like serine/threonine-protein kinase
MTTGPDPEPGVDAGGSATPAAIGPYQVLGRLGAGGLGEVFRARDTIHGRTVALKRVPAAVTADLGRAANLRSLAEAISRVSHPGLAALYECGESDGELYLAAEYVPGQSLAELTGGRGLNPRRAVEIALDIAEALAALHDAGLTHGDLRPYNIVVTPKGRAKLIDPGLAPFTAGGALRASAASRLGELPASAASTLRYLAPEQAAGERTDARGDVFALGSVLYEMLTGQSPFDRPTTDEIVVAVLQATPAPPSARVPTVPAELDIIISRALAKSMDRRYPTAAGLADDLRLVKSVLDAELDQPLAAVPYGEPPRRAAAVVVTALILLLALLAWWQWPALAALF